MISNASQGAK